MKPLASAVIERSVVGGILLLGSLGFAAVALTQAETKRPVFVFLVLPIVVGTFGYWFTQRRVVSEIIARARESEGADREPPWRTGRRVAPFPVLLLVVMAGWAWVSDEPAIGGVMLAAFGGAELVAAFRLRRWERGQGVHVLHEPSSRWHRPYAADPQDFHLVRNAGA
jgi:hypothetical protein